jgi:lysyl-tRNA synthetase class 1
MAKEVFRYPVPGRYEYEWIQIKGKGAMSSSKGIVLLPAALLEIMPPEALRRIVLGRDPARALDLDLAEGFPRFMDGYRAETEEKPVPFTHLVTVAQTVRGDVNAAADMLCQGGYREAAADHEKLVEYLTYARNWTEKWAPEALRFRILLLSEAAEAAKDLDEDQRRYLDIVAPQLENSMSGEKVQDILYSTAGELSIKPKKAFSAVYTVLLGKKNGPKAGPFVAGLSADVVQQRFCSVIRDTTTGGVEG